MKIILLYSKAPGVYVFGELLDMPNILDLETTPHVPYLRLLTLFAYGTYRQYSENKADYPELTDIMQVQKLLTEV